MMPEDYTKCPWCGGSFDDYVMKWRVYPFTEDNPKYYGRHECQNCLFSISQENWDKFCYYQKEIDETEESVLCDAIE